MPEKQRNKNNPLYTIHKTKKKNQQNSLSKKNINKTEQRYEFKLKITGVVAGTSHYSLSTINQ
jgi:hypothetical protein